MISYNEPYRYHTVLLNTMLKVNTLADSFIYIYCHDGLLFTLTKFHILAVYNVQHCTYTVLKVI